ncbi:hypothetical protein AJ80_06793 [Polytolypa hystricis UAMH7299]|uniref:Zn(2)-C6 fungal-type domain-containing protein n=1 Tax=Polytolypa hystricis (strain UAMH7299) TaxID=1447883 RepID=A0A2B7XTI7_POLH7|nr:hypothetical protein AJ80_06793 [Polytolypa hystricis UAMH7299]
MTRRERKQPESRRRTGCWTCKEKHVQCTEELPRCSRCERLDLDCVRGIKLLWKEDAAQRGIHFGREGTWSKRSSKIKKPSEADLDREFHAVPTGQYMHRWLFLNSTYWDFGNEEAERPRHVDADGANNVLMSLGVSGIINNGIYTGPPLQRAIVHTPYPSTESYLLEYFIDKIGPNCSLSPFYNPYLKLVTPIASWHEPLRNTLLAIAANQRRLLGDRRYVNEAVMYKQRALTGLQTEINEKKPSFGTVATVLMLCFHDIADGCTPSWITHLRGGLQLIDLLPQSQSVGEIKQIKQFFVMYFVAHEIMARTAVEDTSSEESGSFDWLDDDNLEEIDVLMGCSRGLMTLIRQIAELSVKKSKITKNRPLTPDETTHFSTCRDKLEASLQVVRQVLPSYASQQEELLRIAETKRLSAMLYLRERLGNPSTASTILHPLLTISLSPRTSCSAHPATTPHNPIISGAIETSSSACKSRLISAIISLIDTLPDTPTLLWPLFIVGNVGLDDEVHRRFVLERLQSIQKVRNLGSVRRAREVVESAYRARDLDHPRGKIWGDQRSGMISLA